MEIHNEALEYLTINFKLTKIFSTLKLEILQLEYFRFRLHRLFDRQCDEHFEMESLKKIHDRHLTKFVTKMKNINIQLLRLDSIIFRETVLINYNNAAVVCIILIICWEMSSNFVRKKNTLYIQIRSTSYSIHQ